MTIIVSKIFQSPCTPAQEVDYLVTINNENPGGLDKIPFEEDNILRYLEQKSLDTINNLHHLGAPKA